jgi:uncharacterized membrane protein YGL010W
MAAWFREYADAHRHPMNRLTHKIAIPFIVFHVLAMLDWIRFADVTLPSFLGGGPYWFSLGHVAYVGAVAFYLRHSVALGSLMAAILLPLFGIAAVTPKWLVVVIAVVGWIVQLIGHSVYEKNRPAFLKNMLQALVGPLFFLAVLVGAFRPRYTPAC